MNKIPNPVLFVQQIGRIKRFKLMDSLTPVKRSYDLSKAPNRELLADYMAQVNNIDKASTEGYRDLKDPRLNGSITPVTPIKGMFTFISGLGGVR